VLESHKPDAPCTILSGDVLMEDMCARLTGLGYDVTSCVFLTDVAGVYDKTPTPGTKANLLPTLLVNAYGSIRNLPITSTKSHDVTGGILAKLTTAARIAASGIPVRIVQVASRHAGTAMAGKVPAVGSTLLLENDFY